MNFVKPIFEVPLLIGKADCAEACNDIVRLAYELRDSLSEGSLVSDEWDVGTKSSSIVDYQRSGVTSFNSTQDLFRMPQWQKSCDFIYTFAKQMIDSLGQVNNKFRFINMWTTIYPHGAFVPEHVHSNSHISGVFYAKAPKDCGEIVFHDPSWVAKTMFMTNNVPVFPNVCTKYKQEVEDGMMVLFPSWLPHRTLANRSDEDRIIVSFNLVFADVTEISN